MRIRTLVVPTIFLILLVNIAADDVLDPRPFVTQKEISEWKLNEDGHRNIDLGAYNSPTNMVINVGMVIQNGTLEEADLNSTFCANDHRNIISVRNIHVVYPNRPSKNYLLQFDFCELQQWTSRSSRFNLRTDLARQRGTVMTSTYFISKYATFSQDHWMWLEPDFMFAKFTVELEATRPKDARNIGIELLFELVAVDKNGPSVTDFVQAMSLTDSCDGEVDWAKVEVDKEDPHRATVSYKMINSLHWIVWFTPGQRRLYSDRSVTFRATVKTYEDNTIWCEPGTLYCESTVVSTNSTSSMKAVQVALGLSIGIGAALSIGLGIAFFITWKRLKALQIQVWGDGTDYRELRHDSLNLPEEDGSF